MKSNSLRQKVVRWFVGYGVMKNYCLMGTEFQCCKMKRFLWAEGVDSSTTMWMYLMLLNWILNMVTIVNMAKWYSQFQKGGVQWVSLTYFSLVSVEVTEDKVPQTCHLWLWSLRPVPSIPRATDINLAGLADVRKSYRASKLPWGTLRASWQALGFMLCNHAAGFLTLWGEFRRAPWLG